MPTSLQIMNVLYYCCCLHSPKSWRFHTHTHTELDFLNRSRKRKRYLHSKPRIWLSHKYWGTINVHRTQIHIIISTTNSIITVQILSSVGVTKTILNAVERRSHTIFSNNTVNKQHSLHDFFSTGSFCFFFTFPTCTSDAAVKRAMALSGDNW